MRKYNWKVFGCSLAISMILIFVMLNVVTFQNKTVVIEEIADTNFVEKEVSRNFSSLSDDEVMDLVLQKYKSFQSFLQNTKYYHISEVARGYNSSDDSQYIVINEDFLNSFLNFLSMDLVNSYIDEIEEVTPYSNVLLNSRIYKIERSFYSSLYLQDVQDVIFTLKSATDEKISVLLTLKEKQKTFYYSFDLVYEENTWKICEFVKIS